MPLTKVPIPSSAKLQIMWYNDALVSVYLITSELSKTYQGAEGPVRISRGPKIFPSVCVSRPLLACAWVTFDRCVRRYCKVRQWWRGMVVEFSRTRLMSLSWLPATAPSASNKGIKDKIFQKEIFVKKDKISVANVCPREKVLCLWWSQIMVGFVQRRISISRMPQWAHPLLTLFFVFSMLTWDWPPSAACKTNPEPRAPLFSNSFLSYERSHSILGNNSSTQFILGSKLFCSLNLQVKCLVLRFVMRNASYNNITAAPFDYDAALLHVLAESCMGWRNVPVDCCRSCCCCRVTAVLRLG